MKNSRALSLTFLVIVLFAGLGTTAGAEQATQEPLSVAATGKNIEAIVVAVGGDQVDTFSLFKGCILRNDLNVEPASSKRLATADIVVWTGFLKESAAINTRIQEERAGSPGIAKSPEWIDISKDTARVNVPTTNCYGYLDVELASGDPFFWLNPQNGPVIARNIAEGLSTLRPEKRKYFMSNLETFTKSLNSDINRWKKQLSQIADLRIFATLCGWQNFSRFGGPNFVVYKATPGSLPTYDNLLEQLKRMKVEFVILDPSTSAEDKKSFREESGFTVLEIPSCIETIPGAKTYSELFENLIQVLLKSTQNRVRG